MPGAYKSQVVDKGVTGRGQGGRSAGLGSGEGRQYQGLNSLSVRPAQAFIGSAQESQSTIKGVSKVPNRRG